MRHKKRLKERWVLGEYLIEMAELLKSGTSLGEALELTAGGVADGAAQVAFLQVADSVAAGGELAAALKAAFPGLPAFCVEMLGQAQREGDLPRVLLELGGYMEDMQSLRLYDASIAKTFVYPIAVSLIGMIVIGILMIFVIPQFQDMFANFGAELPAITVGVMKVSELFVDYWWMLLLAAILLSVVWKLLYPLSPGLRRLPGAIIS
ncbi:MAG: hypothetical protein GY731_17895, partial [Gammaproteobacteria bacterium]|nr:hypothetical protein [Gammaproteobacteria bacterium]